MHIVPISQRFPELGNEGVLVLLQESKGAERSGHTSPSHRISPKLLQV